MRHQFLRTVVGNGGAPPGSLLLDDYPGALMALSLRALSSSTINVARVMRTSDNAESDFTATEVADGTMLAWCGASDGQVVTLYDQGVNGNHASNAFPSGRPLVVVAGVQVMEAGLPSILFPTGQNKSLASAANPAGRADLYVATTLDKTGPSLLAWGSGSFYGWTAGASDTSTIIYQSFGTPSLHVNGIAAAPANRGDVYNLFNGRKLQTTINANVNWAIKLGGYNSTVAYQGNLQEFIVYNSNTSTNRIGIESDINSSYNIF